MSDQEELLQSRFLDLRAQLGAVSQLAFTRTELDSLNSKCAALRAWGVDAPEIYGEYSEEDDLVVVPSGTITLPAPLANPLIIAIFLLLYLIMRKALERSPVIPRIKEDIDEKYPYCRSESSLQGEVWVLFSQSVQGVADQYVSNLLAETPTICGDAVRYNKSRVTFFWKTFKDAQYGVMQVCSQRGELLAYAQGYKDPGSGGGDHAEELALPEIEMQLILVDPKKKRGGTLWSVTISKACKEDRRNCEARVTSAAQTLLKPGGRPVFSHIGRLRFGEMWILTDTAFEKAWITHCGALPPGISPGKTDPPPEPEP